MYVDSRIVPELTPHERRNIVKLRIAETSREIGLLLFTFAPLDFFFDPRPVGVTRPVVVALVAVALLLMVYGIVAEKRIYNAD